MPNHLIRLNDIVTRDGKTRRRDPRRGLPANEVQQSGERRRCSLIIGPLRSNAFHELAPGHFSGDSVAEINSRNGEFASPCTHSIENRHIFEIVSRLNPKTCGASRRLLPSLKTNCRTAA